MAIPFLSNIDLNKNQLLNHTLHNATSNPSSPNEGQIYYNTSSDKVLVYNGSAWVSIAGDIESVSSTTTNQLTVTSGTGPDVSLAIVTGSVTNGGTGLATGDQIYDFVTGFNYLTANQTITLSGDVSGSGATAITVTINSDAVEAGMLNNNVISGQTALTTGLASTDEFLISDAGVIKRMDVSVLQSYMQSNLTFTTNTNTTYDLNVQAGGANTSVIRLAGSDATNDDVTISGTSTTVKVTESGNTITLDLQDDVTIANDLTVTGDLTVSGSTTTVNTETINLADNIITLNSNYSGSSPTENGGIEVERGTLNNAVLRWNEGTDRWQFTNDGGTTYYNIPISTEYNNYTHPTHTARTIDLDATGASVISTIDFTSNTLGHVTSASATTRTLTLGNLGYTGATDADNYGSWTIQDGDTTSYTVTSGDTLQIASGGGITSNFTADDVLTISHNDTSSQASVNNSGTTVIQDVTLDTYGHVTDLASVDLTSGINSLIDAKISATGYAVTITDTATVTHNLGTDVIIQLFDITTGETVYADVDRISTTQATITFASTPTNSIRVLVQQIN
jgi:hypothetical protein